MGKIRVGGELRILRIIGNYIFLYEFKLDFCLEMLVIGK